ncbi:uncharacterized protein KNAG_0M01210 [Huiozyma naganishii CBS 8797]|uniref:Glutamate pyruvate transaminase n=1 Tax=Huiozyma naganishii (strain ATCC MYA-139 / BCRC 22969 / CBS 8797 / KCTC 17520 / NBRC 10181 / NCYC 3082 / Yp74L-3) TaxID=1071383 RepID=J7SAS2_HUIN7|nr:hypothetical protein KNAG_0M01210 [Kazachstania naganishii CBS 8797]CCK72974.1 hypothetical protein KNAG_0M01210 [Kazachstania naganishii CBS 8797]
MILSNEQKQMHWTTSSSKKRQHTGDDSTVSGLAFEPARKLGADDLNKNIIDAEYAVRGAIPMKAEELEIQLSQQPDLLPFNAITVANIGNPQQLDQKPLTFSRQVVSILQYPPLLDYEEQLVTSGAYKRDAFKRAAVLLEQIGGSVGAYSLAQGVYGIRESVADFITRRDEGETASPDDIFLTDGASKAATYLLSILCRDSSTGIMIPIPQYPLYTASITMYNSVMLPYYLDEESGWSTKAEEIEQQVIDSIKRGVTPRVIVVINPGNPTGAVLSFDTIAQILTIAAKYGIVVLADEVYQNNIYKGVKFHSMKKVLRSLQRDHPNGEYDNVQLASMHSTSKGVSGECGQRGGYMELVGFSNEVRQVILKLASISICSVVTGQALVDLMLNPPREGDDSYELDVRERKEIHNNMKTRGYLLYDTFQKLEGIECQEPQGAMYLFPKLLLSKKAIEEAKSLGLQPDEFYCHRLLDTTGICTVPGSGFGQKEGTYHVRTTFLAPGTQWIKDWETFHKAFYDKYRD